MLGVLGQATFSGLLCRFVAGWSLCGMCVRTGHIQQFALCVDL